jgi:hypothetical protein
MVKDSGLQVENKIFVAVSCASLPRIQGTTIFAASKTAGPPACCFAFVSFHSSTACAIPRVPARPPALPRRVIKRPCPPPKRASVVVAKELVVVKLLARKCQLSKPSDRWTEDPEPLNIPAETSLTFQSTVLRKLR